MRLAIAAALMILLPVYGLFCLIWYPTGSHYGTASGSSDAPPLPLLAPDVHPVTAAPVSFFQTHCMRCHGPYGSWYESESVYSPAEHRALLREMIEGQASTTLDDDHREVQYHLYRAMAAKVPFIAISKREPDVTTGEFIPGSALTATVNGTPVNVTLAGNTFIIPAPAIGLKVTAVRNGRSITLQADKQTYTPMD